MRLEDALADDRHVVRRVDAMLLEEANRLRLRIGEERGELRVADEVGALPAVDAGAAGGADADGGVEVAVEVHRAEVGRRVAQVEVVRQSEPCLFRRPGVAVVLAALHIPRHILRLDAPLQLENPARPQPDRLLVVADAEPLALEVFRVVLPDAGRLANVDVRVGEDAVVEHGEHPVGEAQRPHPQVGRHGHFRDVVAVELDLLVEHAGHGAGHALVVQRDAVGLDLAGGERRHAVVRGNGEREVQVGHSVPPAQADCGNDTAVGQGLGETVPACVGQGWQVTQGILIRWTVLALRRPYA